MPSEVGRPIPCIDQVAIDSPDLVIVCRHFGYPWAEEMIAPAKVLEGLDALELPAATRAAFPGGNAARVRFVSGRAVTA
jgi:predicted TIM-barrel fold metal-dependent hydrolase